MAVDASRSEGNTVPRASLFQRLVSEKLKELQCASGSKNTAVRDEPTNMLCHSELSRDSGMAELQSPPGNMSLSSAPCIIDLTATPSEASSAGHSSRSSLPVSSPAPRVNPFENGYVAAVEPEREESDSGAPLTHVADDNDKEDGEVSESESEPEPEPAAKRLKKSATLDQGPACTCAISTTCERAAATGVRDCRLALISIPKRTRPAVDNNKAGLRTTQYISKKKQMEIKRSNGEILDILSQFKKCSTAPRNTLPRIYQLMRDRVHHLHLCEIPPTSVSIIKTKLLDSNSGLPAIVRSKHVPWDIRLDADMYLMRLKRADIDPDIHRGLIVSRSIQEGTAKPLSRSIDPNYQFKRSAFFLGEGHLRVGQWFPYRICAIRDGAHGELEGGIAGRENMGAVSIILSGSSSTTAYPDIDQGDTILYCGTRGKNGKVSLSTSFMLESSEKKNEIRVLRSSKLPKVNPYRPAEGIRYDGLYKITEHELLEEASLLYRFTLKRIDGQHPIRYQGAWVRPTEREVKELQSLREHVSFTKPTPSKKS